MNDPIYIFVGLAAGLALGYLLARVFAGGKRAEVAASQDAEQLIAAAEAEAAEIRRAAEVEQEEQILSIRDKLEADLAEKKREQRQFSDQLAQKRREVEKLERETAKRESSIKKREKALSSKEKQAEELVAKAESEQARAKAELEEVAGLTAEQAQERLEDALRADARASVAKEIEAYEKEARETADAKSREIIATAIQRYASDFVAERTVSVIPLPSDDMKGRLIGREGRNIRALEAATGIDMIIDDTSGVITISCFNPVRREIARLAIARLVSDGRIHPTRIEEVVRKAEREVDKHCKEAGEQATFDLDVHNLHPELVLTLGRLKYRSSFAQNLLQHSVEVGYLAGLMAAELGGNIKQARRAGLLSCIGKAVEHDIEGNYSEVGSKLARKHGEAAAICQAIRCHPNGREPATILDNIVMASQQLSTARPGARREQLAGYVSRLEEMEEICSRFDGVDRVFALQAGREVRVMVQNSKISDADARMLSKDIAQELQRSASYPGAVRVVVVRETRASDYAR